GAAAQSRARSDRAAARPADAARHRVEAVPGRDLRRDHRRNDMVESRGHRGMETVASACVPAALQPDILVGISELPLWDRCRACRYRAVAGARSRALVAQDPRILVGRARLLSQPYRRLRLLRISNYRGRAVAGLGQTVCPA